MTTRIAFIPTQTGSFEFILSSRPDRFANLHPVFAGILTSPQKRET